MESLLQAALGHLYFALLIILLTFSPILHSNKEEGTVINNSLDSDFLEMNALDKKEEKKALYFWRIHRIFSISLGSIGLFAGIMSLYHPSIPTQVAFLVFFVLSVLLWYQPKWGSFITSIFSCLCMGGGISLIFLTKDMEEVKYLYTPFTIMIVVSFFICFMGSIPFILLNKEARKEWKMKK